VAKKTRFRLPVNTGIRPDQFAEDVKLLDINNLVLNPRGSALRPREGFEIRRNDGIGFGATRKQIYFISNPPDIDYGDMITVSNPANERRAIECTEVVRTTNTVSSENPLPMPELPVDPEPSEATKNAPLMYTLETGGSGSNIYLARVLVWDDANEQVVGPVVLNNVSHDSNMASLMRSENYLVSCAPSNGPGMYVKVWDIDAMVANPGFTHDPIRTIAVFEEDVFDPWESPMWIYKGDIAYVAVDLDPDGSHDHRLYAVDLSTGGVSYIALTGVTFDLFRTMEAGSMPVASDGYLCGSMTDGSDNYPYRINPSTGVCTVGEIAFTSSTGYGGMLIADGSLMFITSGSRIINLVDNSLNVTTPEVSPLSLQTAAWSTMHTNAAIGNKAIGQGAVGGYTGAFMIDVSTDTTYDPLSEELSNEFWTPASVFHDGTKFAICGIDYQSTVPNSDLFFVNVSDGSLAERVPLAGIDTADEDIYNYIPIGDAWAYGIQNTQGELS